VSGWNGQKLFIIGRGSGRLANRLVLFANFVAHAEEHGHRLVNVTFHPYANLFETTRRDFYCRYPATTGRSLFDAVPGVAEKIRRLQLFPKAVRYASKLNQAIPLFGKKVVTLREFHGREVTLLDDQWVEGRIAGARIVFAYDWRFRSPNAVQKHAAKIRAYFRPLSEIEKASREAIQQIRQKADVVIGVHVRQGDYRIWKKGKFLFETERYAAWMRSVETQFPGRRVAFLVSSDEPRSREEFGDLSVEIVEGTAVEALFALAECDFIFGPPSTFSQWASFYGDVPLLQLWTGNDALRMERFEVSRLLEIPS
jgi:hypothetical protein